jgi:hypothetical protein
MHVKNLKNVHWVVETLRITNLCCRETIAEEYCILPI